MRIEYFLSFCNSNKYTNKLLRLSGRLAIGKTSSASETKANSDIPSDFVTRTKTRFQ